MGIGLATHSLGLNRTIVSKIPRIAAHHVVLLITDGNDDCALKIPRHFLICVEVYKMTMFLIVDSPTETNLPYWCLLTNRVIEEVQQ